MRIRWFLIALFLFSLVGQPTFSSAASSGISNSSLGLNFPSEQVYEYRMYDGIKIKVHFVEETLKESSETSRFAKEALDAAVQAYQTITQFQGFSTVGYSFAFPDRSYAFDADRTIDIFLGSPASKISGKNSFLVNLSFKDSPCFDTIKVSETQFEAIILLPSNYREFIRNWEKINPSPLGVRNINVDLRGTLIHEMLHVILFYYNKNLNKDMGHNEVSTQGVLSAGKKVDWYVEGLARYFETFAGARHDFFSQGFKQTLPDKIRFSRGGSNYFMRYPDQAFTDLRYENALFWRFIDYRYGIQSIEQLSRDFRDFPNRSFEQELEKVSHSSFKELLKHFSMSILLKDFGLKDDETYLKDIARTRLAYENGNFYLLNGSDEKKLLGKVCQTDWVGKWGGESADFDQPGVGGDNTEKSDVSGWATDYFEITPDGVREPLPNLQINHHGGGQSLLVQCVLVTKGGSLLTKDLGEIPSGDSRTINTDSWVNGEGLASKDISTIYLLITNSDPAITADYEIAAIP